MVYPPYLRALLIVAAVAGCSKPKPGAQLAPRTFRVVTVRVGGALRVERAPIAAFLDCLLVGSTFNRYWEGRAGLARGPSVGLPAPPTRLYWDEIGDWLDGHAQAGRLPAVAAAETPVYLLFAGWPHLVLGACGRHEQRPIGGRDAALATVRTGRSCWPTDDPLRSLTQIAAHELLETVDASLGHAGCAGGGSCRGAGICPDHCATFVGLNCEGAPRGSFTGCEGGKVDGWVVQRFGKAGRDHAKCEHCIPCEFTPEVCPAAEPRCGRWPASDTSPAP